MTSRQPRFWPERGAALIDLFDRLYSAAHSLKNAVVLLPVRDAHGNEDVAAGLSYCLTDENVTAVEKYGRSVDSLLDELSRQWPEREAGLSDSSVSVAESIVSTVTVLLSCRAEIAERVGSVAEHASRFKATDGMSDDDRERFLGETKENLARLHACLAGEEKGVLAQVGSVLQAAEVGTILNEAAQPMLARAETLGIEVQMPSVSGRRRLLNDPEPLTEVLDGLLSNALDAVVRRSEIAPADYRGKIQVALQGAQEAVGIRITDNGCGIAPEVLEQIQKGERVTTKGSGHGGGLLSARRRLGVYPNSLLHVRSEGLGEGACVIAQFDLAVEAVPEADPTGAPRASDSPEERVTMFCVQCGTGNPEGAAFCAACGGGMVTPRQLLARGPADALAPLVAGSAVVAPTSGMATASIVLGIAGLVTAGLSALAGLVVGVVALVQVNRSEGRLQGHGLAIAGIVTSTVVMVAIAPIVLFVLVPALSYSSRSARNSACRENLKHIGTAMIEYAKAHDGRLPEADNWREAIRPHLPAGRKHVLRCPAQSDDPGSYAFNAELSGRELSAIKSASERVLVFDARPSHGAAGGPELADGRHGGQCNAVFADGHVDKLPHREVMFNGRAGEVSIDSRPSLADGVHGVVLNAVRQSRRNLCGGFGYSRV